MCAYVYAALQPNLLGPRCIGDSRTLIWAVRDSRSERSSDTRANDCDTRASRDAITPVAGTMLVGSRSEERRVGKERRSRWSRDDEEYKTATNGKTDSANVVCSRDS